MPISHKPPKDTAFSPPRAGFDDCREFSTNRPYFMQNKANFRKSQMNVNLYNTRDYENKSNWTLSENKPNSNPNKANLPEGKIDAKCVVTKDYRKYDDFAVQKNKPNFRKAKMKLNFYSTKDYENERRLPALGKQTQTNPKSNQKLNSLVWPFFGASCAHSTPRFRSGQASLRAGFEAATQD